MKFITGLALVNAAAAVNYSYLPPWETKDEKRIFGLYLDAMDGEIDNNFRREDLYALLREASKQEHGGWSSVRDNLSSITDDMIVKLVNWNLQNVFDKVDLAWKLTDRECSYLHH